MYPGQGLIEGTQLVGGTRTFHKFPRETCGGGQLHVIDRTTFKPVLPTAAMFHEFHAAAPDRFVWRQPPYEYEPEKMPIDILSGSSDLRQQIESGMGRTTSRRRGARNRLNS